MPDPMPDPIEDPTSPALEDGALPDPRALARHYTRFRVGERLLLAGHARQAWPDVALEGQQRSFLDAAEHMDDRWAHALATADRVRAGYRRLLGDGESGEIALGGSTFEMVARLLSALPLRTRPRLVATEGEFTGLRRMIDRLGEEGIAVERVPARPVETLAERLAAEVDGRTALVVTSSVLSESAEIVPHLETVAQACVARGAELLVGTRHHLNVLPFHVGGLGLGRAFVTGDGIAHCQLGEGNAFLRVPADCELRPILTGRFAEPVSCADAGGSVGYGGGAARFAGPTYDPASHYRAAAVFDFHEEQRLTPEVLRAVSQRQMRLLVELCGEWPIPYRVRFPRPSEEVERLAGFLALHTPLAPMLVRLLRERRVVADHRGEVLRLGPAPYVRDDQLAEGVTRLATLLAEG